MSYIFGDNVDFNKNQASKLRLGNEITFPTLTSGDTGYVFYHTANKKFYGWTGTEWTDFATGITGGGGDNLGDHNATEALDMNNFPLTSVANVSFQRGGTAAPVPSISYNDTNGFYFFPHIGQPFAITGNLTNVRELTVQDKSGTIALLDDITSSTPYPALTTTVFSTGELTFDAVTDFYSTNPTAFTLRRTNDGKHVSFYLSLFGSVSHWISGNEYILYGIISLDDVTYADLKPLQTNQNCWINLTTNSPASVNISSFDVLRSSVVINQTGTANVFISFSARVKSNINGSGSTQATVNIHGLYPIKL